MEGGINIEWQYLISAIRRGCRIIDVRFNNFDVIEGLIKRIKESRISWYPTIINYNNRGF